MTAYSGLSDREAWYENIQGNILKPHGRDHHRVLLLTFDGADRDATKEWIRKLPVTSFRKQLDDAIAYRAGDRTTDCFLSFLLSATGYEALGYGDDDQPSDGLFRGGMKAAAARLHDPVPSQWDEPHRGRIDAAILLADDDLDRLDQTSSRIVDSALRRLGSGAVLGIEKGRTNRDAERMAREPFGFRDGLSNPLFLERDIEQAREHGSDKFDPRALKELVLVRDPNAADAYGSYVVLRKLAQNVRGFRAAEREMTQKLGLPSDSELAAAMVIGRFRNGTPLAESGAPAPQGTAPTSMNNWDYAGDANGARCPFHSHVRKVNDRAESLRTGAGLGDERSRRIARRGFTFYDDDSLDFSDLASAELRDDELPENGIGTMFIGYQSSIRDQFEHLMVRFANNVDYFTAHSGADALIGVRSESSAPYKWSRAWDSSDQAIHAPMASFVTLKGGEYFFAPSIPFLESLPDPHRASSDPVASTPRTRKLRDALVARAFTNRKDEWFTADMLPPIFESDPDAKTKPVIIRQAIACDQMLQAMTDPEKSRATRTYEIRPGELIVGTMPMGSVGLGKTFPPYLTDDEARASSLSNRDEGSVFAHTVPNFRRVLEKGLDGVIAECRERMGGDLTQSQRDFYEAVILCCQAVIDYAGRFADLAEAEGLAEIAAICRNVPARPAQTFHEAVQCIWFVHLAETAFCAFNSLGRLDQILDPYLQKDLAAKRITRERAVEILECFLIKGAERVNLNPTTLRDQDFLSFGTGIGTQPIYLDQVASCNNFIQNIVLGGTKEDGADATNDATLLFLEALGGIGLSTPTINVRMHKNSPAELKDAVDRAFRRAQNGHPILYNDDTVIPGLVDAGLPLEEARDFALAGCWEPMLHGKNSFIFGMVNMLRVLECALNEGTLFQTDPQFLRGQKQSWRTPPPDQYASFDELMEAVRRHMLFFADKIALGTCTFFILPSAMTPTPFMSMLLDGCLERGVDQSLGGADYNIISNIAFAVPNTINALANIKKYVFEEKRWTLGEVAAALRANWGLAPVRSEYEIAPESDAKLRDTYLQMRRTFVEMGPKFGNAVKDVDAIGAKLMTFWYEACKSAEELTRRAFLAEPNDTEAAKLRTMANYPAPSLRESLRNDFDLHFTIGAGTFGQYSSMGKGVSASADGRAANEALAPNTSPQAGTATNGLTAVFDSLQALRLERFGGAVVTDIRVDGTNQPQGFFRELVEQWVARGGNMLTVSVLSTAEIAEMLRVTDIVRANPKDVQLLVPYADRFCRVGGWNSGFVCLPRPQQRDHLLRATY